MQRQQNLKKYLPHLYTLGSDKFPKLLELFVKSGKEYAKQNDQGGFVRTIRGEFLKNKGVRGKELIRTIYVFDSVVKEIKSFRQPIAQVIGQIFVQLFSIFFENNFQSQIEDMKMIRKSWATLLPDDVLEKIQKDILSAYNFNLDKGFSKKKIDELTNYYTTKIKLPPEVYNKYLPSIQNSKTNDILQHFSSDSGQQPFKRRKLIKPEPPLPPAPSVAPTYNIPPPTYPPNYLPTNYPNTTNPSYMYPMPQYPQMPIQQIQPMIKNPYYYQNGMPIPPMGSYNNYYGTAPMGMYSGMSSVPAMPDYKMNPYYNVPQAQAQTKSKQRQEAKKPKQRVNSKYKELVSFGRYRCPCCGMASNRRDYFDLHLKSHFQQSKQDYERSKRQTPIKRSVCLDVEEWMPAETKDSQITYFVEMNKSNENYCKLCSNAFSPSWDSSLEKWIYRDVVLVELDQKQKCCMHYSCFTTLNEEAGSDQ